MGLTNGGGEKTSQPTGGGAVWLTRSFVIEHPRDDRNLRRGRATAVGLRRPHIWPRVSCSMQTSVTQTISTPCAITREPDTRQQPAGPERTPGNEGAEDLVGVLPATEDAAAATGTPMGRRARRRHHDLAHLSEVRQLGRHVRFASHSSLGKLGHCSNPFLHPPICVQFT